MSDIEKIIVSHTSKFLGAGKSIPMITFEICTIKKLPSGKGWCDCQYKKISEITADEWERKDGTKEEKKGLKRWQRKYLEDLEKTYLNGAMLEKNNLPGFN